ncbi:MULTISPECIES: hypothetical protein [unclassified Streptomyces]|uniref:hypothetical protein n=1 Tax=unclassified Streptomyces TaxID=2593676 RepID=UPI0033BCF3DE
MRRSASAGRGRGRDDARRGSRSAAIRAGTGFQGKGRLGPLLKTPPLTRAQLDKLIRNPALLP